MSRRIAIKSIRDSQAAEFRTKVQALCDEYGFSIDGCGCCGSPWLMDERFPGDSDMSGGGRFIAEKDREVKESKTAAEQLEHDVAELLGEV